MARLKEDDTSWKARGVLRRDFRHAEDVSPYLPAGPKKDTNKWCKGKVGKLHDYVLNPDYAEVGRYASKYACRNCGKQQY